MDVSDRPESKDGRLHLAVMTCTEVLGDVAPQVGPTTDRLSVVGTRPGA